ncbi:MAG: dipeptide epimerase [Alphaproteobacteria bacterium]|nr:dipeptide epimerase [Alphaproteobacteria bacterium]
MSDTQPQRVSIASLAIEDWPLARPFIISRGQKTSATVIHLTLTAGGKTGHGEAVPYARYSETPDQTLAQIRNAPLTLDRQRLLRDMPPGAARNAIDCAIWDLQAKLADLPAYRLANQLPPQRIQTCFTISLASPQEMADEAAEASDLKLLKLKLGGGLEDADRMAAVRHARPDARLVADANEAWLPGDLKQLLAVAARHDFELIEQPLPVDADAQLAQIDSPLPICADESAHTTQDLSSLKKRYDAVNIKLDKAGGLTEALNMANEARRLGFKIMVGSMVSTSLAVAPAMLLAAQADWVDLDGPLLLARDRDNGLSIHRGWIEPAGPQHWG